MAKAGKKPSTTTTWILLSVALDLLVDYYRDRGIAKRILLRALFAGDVDWRCARFEGRREPGDPDVGDPRFWRQTPATPADGVVYPDGGVYLVTLQINWEQDSAKTDIWNGCYTAVRIEVSREDVLALLPAEIQEEPMDGPTGSGIWISTEAKNMKKAGEIPANIGKSDFARELETRMRKAAKADPSIRPVKWTHIKNKLLDWGLWPISAIK
jgi:hypothetical protein